MSKILVDTIDTRSGTSNITIGSSNASQITLKSGATLTNFPANTPAFKVKLSSNQSISTSTTTKIAFDTELYDTDNAFDNSTNYRFTVPTGKGGKYHFSGIVIVRNIDLDEQNSIRIWVNGSDTVSGLNVYRMTQYGTGNNTFTTAPVSADIDLSEGDYVELRVFQNEGSSQDVDSGYSHFEGFRLIGA